MGNNPSAASKPTTPTATTGGTDSPRATRRDRDHRSPIPVTPAYGTAAPPEPSHAQAHGSTTSTASSRSKAIPVTSVSSLSGGTSPSPSSSGVNSAVATSSARSPEASARIAAHQDAFRDEPAKPVAVPGASAAASASAEPQPVRSHGRGASVGAVLPNPALDDVAAIANNLSLSDMSYLARPPRLPLPTEEQLKTPGSPILPATEGDEIIDDEDDVLEPRPEEQVSAKDEAAAAAAMRADSSSDAMTRKSSAVSAATTDDEFESSDEYAEKQAAARPRVPTRLDWLRGGDKVYVTGSMFSWNKKHRLQPVDGRPGAFTTTIYVPPAIHHLRFLVDGLMQTSPDLPTTVDLGNNLVNFIEVSAEDIPTQPVAAPEASDTAAADAAEEKQEQARAKGKLARPASQYVHSIPRYLEDFDQSEDSPQFMHAAQALEKLPNPPSLPGFLAKPILNVTGIRPEDNSVLVQPPNHTILNHLATSSIKNGIVAVSATTRYKNKYVTTIIYKPSAPSG